MLETKTLNLSVLMYYAKLYIFTVNILSWILNQIIDYHKRGKHFHDTSTYKLQLQQSTLSTIMKKCLQCILDKLAGTPCCGTSSHNKNSIIRSAF